MDRQYIRKNEPLERVGCIQITLNNAPNNKAGIAELG